MSFRSDFSTKVRTPKKKKKKTYAKNDQKRSAEINVLSTVRVVSEESWKFISSNTCIHIIRCNLGKERKQMVLPSRRTIPGSAAERILRARKLGKASKEGTSPADQ